MTLNIQGVTHWSIPVNDLEESERFYRDVLGLEYRGRLGNSGMACFRAGTDEILLCERQDKVRRSPEQDNRLHHAFTVSPEDWERGVKLFAELGVPVDELMYREHGFFTGRELYFLDPSGNMLEIRDPTWQQGMPKPTLEEIVGASPAKA
jgi:catechol 2,3-dioxygenase-like lactoylglutathione lyase family enzyme